MKGKCSNERGITLASNFGKLLERIVNQRIIQKVNMTYAQAGGRKKESTADHIMRLQDTINHVRIRHKKAYVAFLDVTKAYDKAWLDAILYVLNKEGLDNKTWKLVKEINSNLKATIETEYGFTREISITDSIRQGGVISVIEYALLMDEINKEIEAKEIGPKIDNISKPIGCLLWVDDVALIAGTEQELQKMLVITNDIANRFHIEFGKEKSKVLIIGEKGKNPNKPNLKLGSLSLEYTDSYKYLGIRMNNKNNLQDVINDTKCKSEAAYQTIITVMNNKHFNDIQLETAWKLYEACIIPILTYASEVWKPNRKEWTKIEHIQLSIIKRILMVPTSTPNDAIYIELGLLEIETIAAMKRIRMENRINKDKTTLKWKIKESKPKNGWQEQTDRIKTAHNLVTGSNTEDIIMEKMKDKINRRARSKTKTKFLLDNKEWKPKSKEEYLRKMTRYQASLLFKARTRMLDVKGNYKTKYHNLECRRCGSQIETQEHILSQCTAIHEKESSKVQTEDLFANSPRDLLQNK